MMKLTLTGGVVAIGLVVILGLYLFGIGLRNVGRAAASPRWPRTARGRSCAPLRANNMMSDKKTGDVSVIYSRHRDPIPGRRQALLDEPDSLWPDAGIGRCVGGRVAAPALSG